MKAIKIIGFVAIVAIALIMITLVPNGPRELTATELANKIKYVKDGHGLCYATLSSAVNGVKSVTSITAVDCEKAGL